MGATKINTTMKKFDAMNRFTSVAYYCELWTWVVLTLSFLSCLPVRTLLNWYVRNMYVAFVVNSGIRRFPNSFRFLLPGKFLETSTIPNICWAKFLTPPKHFSKLNYYQLRCKNLSLESVSATRSANQRLHLPALVSDKVLPTSISKNQKFLKNEGISNQPAHKQNQQTMHVISRLLKQGTECCACWWCEVRLIIESWREDRSYCADWLMRPVRTTEALCCFL